MIEKGARGIEAGTLKLTERDMVAKFSVQQGRRRLRILSFDREAAGLDEAVLSAVTDVEHVEGVNVVRVADAGLVSMTDIANRIGPTRERAMQRSQEGRHRDRRTGHPVERV